ncbi:PREDICTED: uncharacterized protein LOC105148524 [Acromyrmex echinatior]|uniref:uncharacterized protein LOC105148524 n=1 Tax=Acromyrmex echinatior TaxID=103372 RepID=UPI000580EBA0|nr:PREDICTED: uncharacterized protein LOC105148524 [Acromyrmex echinatior]
MHGYVFEVPESESINCLNPRPILEVIQGHSKNLGLVATRAPPRGDGVQRSCLTIRRSPWVTPSWQLNVENLRDRVSDTQNRRLVRVGKRTRRRRHQATVALQWWKTWPLIDTSSLDNSYTPKTICSRCRSVLNEINKQVFSKPMIWRSPTNHATDCFFCLTNMKGYNRKNKNLISYPQVRSVNFPVPIHTNTNDSKEINEEELEDLNDEDLLDGSLECDESQNFSTEESDFEENTADAEKWDQDEVSDLCRDLGNNIDI